MSVIIYTLKNDREISRVQWGLKHCLVETVIHHQTIVRYKLSLINNAASEKHVCA